MFVEWMVWFGDVVSLELDVVFMCENYILYMKIKKYLLGVYDVLGFSLMFYVKYFI